NAFLAFHAGYMSSCQQAFNVKSRTSGFVPGAGSHYDYLWNLRGIFLHDQWRVNDRLSLSAGIRYDYESVIKVANGLMFLPVLENNDPKRTLLSNLNLNFSGPGTGRMPYEPDRNNFGPQAGLAFRLDRSGNTVLRAGFGVYFIEDVSTALFQEA